MSEMISVPVSVWRQVISDLDFLKKAILPLAKGYKQPQWMTADDIMNPADPQHLNIGKDRIRQIKRSGLIRTRRAGRHIEYWRKDIEAYKEGEIKLPSKTKKAPAVTEAIQ